MNCSGARRDDQNTRDQRRRTLHHAVDRIGKDCVRTIAGRQRRPREGAVRSPRSKSEQLTPPERSLTERVLYWYDTHDARLSWRGLHINMGNFSGGAGFAGGIGLTQRAIGKPVVDPHQANRIDLDLSAGRSILGYQRLAARVDVLNIAGAPINVALSWRDDQMPQEDFYGIGPDADHRVNYRLDTTDTTAALEWKPFRMLSIGGGVALLQPVVGPGNDGGIHRSRRRSVRNPRRAHQPAGVPSHRRDCRLRLARQLDASAARRQLSNHRVAVRRRHDERHDFRRLDVQLQQIVPLGNRYRRVELRAQAAVTDTGDTARSRSSIACAGRHCRPCAVSATARFRDRKAVSMMPNTNGKRGGRSMPPYSWMRARS